MRIGRERLERGFAVGDESDLRPDEAAPSPTRSTLAVTSKKPRLGSSGYSA